MRKFTVLVLVLSLVLGCLAGCVPQDSSNPTEIRGSQKGTDESQKPSEKAPQKASERATEPKTEKPTDPPAHVHNYSAATCTTPATCSCGKTDGSPLGHDWRDATSCGPRTAESLVEEFRAAGFPGERATISWQQFEDRAASGPGPSRGRSTR